MKKPFFSLFSILFFLLSACQSSEEISLPTESLEATPEVIEETVEVYTPTPTIDLSAELQEVEGNVEPAFYVN